MNNGIIPQDLQFIIALIVPPQAVWYKNQEEKR